MYTTCIGTRRVYAFNVETYNFQTYSFIGKRCFLQAVVFVVSTVQVVLHIS